MALPGEMTGVVHGDSLHVDVAVTVPALPDRLFKRLERELIKGKARQRADKKAAARRMRRIISSHLAETSPKDVMEDAPAPAPQSELEHPEGLKLPGVKLAIINAGKVKKHKGRKAKNSSFSPPPLHASTPPATPASPSSPPPPPPPPATAAPATAPELERKIARLEAELHSRNRSRQKRNDAFHSLKASEHEKMLDLMDARHHIEGLVAKIARLEDELEESTRETVSWVQRAEKFRGERYQAFADTIDPVTPPPPRAIEWGILAKQPEFWAGVVGVVSLLTAVYAAGRYLGDNAPAVGFLPLFKLLSTLSIQAKTTSHFTNLICNDNQVPLPCPRQIPCPRPPRVESPTALWCPKVECPRVECPRVTDCPTVLDLPPAEKCRGNGHMMAAYGLGVICGGIGTWQTVQAMD